MFKEFRCNLAERLAFNALAKAKFLKAVKHFTKLLDLDPERQGVRYDLGLALLYAEKYDEALGAFNEEERLYGGTYLLYSGMAEAAYRKGSRELAKMLYEKTLGMENQLPVKQQKLHKIRAAICSEEQRYADALAAFSLLEEGDLKKQEKLFEEAEAAYNKAFELDETCYPAIERLGALRMTQKNYKDAVAFYQQADGMIDCNLLQIKLAAATKKIKE